MKILFVGNSEIPWSTNVAMEKTFTALGHSVVSFHYRQIAEELAGGTGRVSYRFMEKLGRVLRKPSLHLPDYFKRIYLRSCGRREMAVKLVEEARRGSYDLIFMAKAGQLDWEVIRELNKHSKTWYWYMDPMETAGEMSALKYAALSTWTSATFSSVTELFATKNPGSYHITEGYDPALTGKALGVKKEIDVIFVGSKDKKRQRYVEYLKGKGIEVLWYGPGADHPPVYLEEMMALYSRSKLILNFTRDNVGFSNRVIETVGLGSMVLTEHCADIEKFFTAGEHLDWFKSEEECAEKIVHYLRNRVDRERIAEAGSRHAKERFSWPVILKKVIRVVEEGQGNEN